MILEARASSCFSYPYVLKLDGRAVGKFDGRWFSESLDIHLTGRRKLIFEKIGWGGSEFVLKSEEPDAFFGHAKRAGFFSSQWNLDLSAGPIELVHAGWFSSSYEIKQGERTIGNVDRLGWCERGWQAQAAGVASMEDLLLIGMVYQTIQRRQQAAAAHGAGS